MRGPDRVDIITFALLRKHFFPPFRHECGLAVQLRRHGFRWHLPLHLVGVRLMIIRVPRSVVDARGPATAKDGDFSPYDRDETNSPSRDKVLIHEC